MFRDETRESEVGANILGRMYVINVVHDCTELDVDLHGEYHYLRTTFHVSYYIRTDISCYIIILALCMSLCMCIILLCT